MSYISPAKKKDSDNDVLMLVQNSKQWTKINWLLVLTVHYDVIISQNNNYLFLYYSEKQ